MERERLYLHSALAASHAGSPLPVPHSVICIVVFIRSHNETTVCADLKACLSKKIVPPWNYSQQGLWFYNPVITCIALVGTTVPCIGGEGDISMAAIFNKTQKLTTKQSTIRKSNCKYVLYILHLDHSILTFNSCPFIYLLMTIVIISLTQHSSNSACYMFFAPLFLFA